MQPKLIIKKRLVQATADQLKPSVNAIARLPLETREIMIDSFGHETLFKKAIMIGTRPTRAGDNLNSVLETKILDAFFKREESLEISVNSLMIGQTYVGDSIWDALGFELITKRAFDSMLVLLETVHEFDDELIYWGANNATTGAPVKKSKPDTRINTDLNDRPTIASSLNAKTANGHDATGARRRRRQDAISRIARARTDETAI